jgi:DNA-binding CsgD family transcriptional regulator
MSSTLTAQAVHGVDLSVVLPAEQRPHEHNDARPSAADPLFEYFVEARGRARAPIACVDSRVLLTNAGAARLLCPDDRHALWVWSQRAIADDDTTPRPLQIRGTRFLARCEAVTRESELIGALIRFGHTAGSRHASSRRAPERHRQSFGWSSLRDSELGIAELVAAGMTNREIGERLYLSRHTVDFHLRQIFRKLGITSRVELTRLVVEQSQHNADRYAA